MTLTVLSRCGLRRALVSDSGVAYYYAAPPSADAPPTWRFDHHAAPALPFHALLDLATRIVNAPSTRRTMK